MRVWFRDTYVMNLIAKVCVCAHNKMETNAWPINPFTFPLLFFFSQMAFVFWL